MIRLRATLGASLFCFASVTAAAQGIPTAQPGMVMITREMVKAGRNAEHEKFEMGWPAAYEHAKSTFNYIALTSMTGPNEAWFISPYSSNSAIGQSMKEEAANPALSAELARLSRGDAEYINGTQNILADARPDLSYGAFPNIAAQRYWEISIFRVRPGHEGQFEQAAKTYIASAKRNAPDVSFRVYQVAAGMPGPAFVIFGSVASYADFDHSAETGRAIMGKMTAEEGAVMQNVSQEGIVNIESQRFALNPAMSFVDKATRDQDPAFWVPRKPPVKKAP